MMDWLVFAGVLFSAERTAMTPQTLTAHVNTIGVCLGGTPVFAI